MSHVLIWRKMNKGCEWDIFNPTDYSTLYERVMRDWNGTSQNWGNRVWLQGIFSALDNGENTYDFLPDIIDIDKINSQYDFIIASLANIFFVEYIDGLRNYAEIFEKIKIPVFVISCGVQADSYNSLDNLVDVIGNDSKRFIRSVYKTGGEFALRGYFTKQFFEKLGFNSAVVTGCPSLFQFGPDFKVNNTKQDIDILNPVFNGHLKPYTLLMKEYPNSIFIDQDEFLKPLLQAEYLKDTGLNFKLDFINNYGFDAAHMIASGRIRMIADTNDWWNYLQNKNFNFSFGSRIHGTIMSILSGIPSTIVAYDSRTREMAEYFDIPMIIKNKKHCFTKNELISAYSTMDYSLFNDRFHQRFDAYEQFFVEHGIVSHINKYNKFFYKKNDMSFELALDQNKDDFKNFSDDLSKNQLYLSVANKLRKLKRRIF